MALISFWVACEGREKEASLFADATLSEEMAPVGMHREEHLGPWAVQHSTPSLDSFLYFNTYLYEAPGERSSDRMGYSFINM